MAETAQKSSTAKSSTAIKATTLGKQAKSDLPKEIFSEPFHESLVHEAARADLAARRRGTHSSLTRGEVAMTTAKAWRQKGTGRARAGALSVPHRYGGGAAFGPKPRHYTVKVNRKARRRALRSALTVHAERGTIGVLDGSTFSEPATKQAAEALRKWGADAPTLVVVTGDEDAVAKSFRNIEGATVALSDAAGVADVIGASSLLVSQAALEELASRASERPSTDAKPRAKRGEVSGEGRAS
jgi:large subunit ribosomal protein L4